MGGEFQTSSRSKRDPFRLNNICYSHSEVGPIADVSHYLVFQVSWDYDEILETVPGQMGQYVMDYRVWTQWKHWLRPGECERTQTRAFPPGQDYGLQSWRTRCLLAFFLHPQFWPATHNMHSGYSWDATWNAAQRG